jgi:hypothetical protein
MRLDLVEGIEDVRPTPNCRWLQEPVAGARRSPECDQIIDGLAQAHVDRGQRDVASMTVGHDVELLTRRELVLMNV